MIKHTKVKANAKINLCLDILGKRNDGYHEISTIMQEISLCDEITITLNDTDIIEVISTSKDVPSGKDNLVYKACDLFFKKAKIKSGCKVVIDKNIPSCAGLGGGSSDGTKVICTLNEMFDYPLSKEDIFSLCLLIGADSPFFINGKTSLCEGIGEIITPIESKVKKWVIIIKSDINISTKEAYKKADLVAFNHPDTKKCTYALINGDENLLFKNASNVFEDVSKDEFPEIESIKESLLSLGAKFSMMSGSGSAIYGIFDSKNEASDAFFKYDNKNHKKFICEFIV